MKFGRIRVDAPIISGLKNARTCVRAFFLMLISKVNLVMGTLP